MSDIDILSVLNELWIERGRQDDKWGIQHHDDGTSARHKGTADYARAQCDQAEEEGRCTWFHILQEEFYEAVTETEWPKLRKELVQVAAVCVAWIEDGDGRWESTTQSPTSALMTPTVQRES